MGEGKVDERALASALKTLWAMVENEGLPWRQRAYAAKLLLSYEYDDVVTEWEMVNGVTLAHRLGSKARRRERLSF